MLLPCLEGLLVTSSALSCLEFGETNTFVEFSTRQEGHILSA